MISEGGIVRGGGGVDDAPFDGVPFVFDEFFVDGMCDEGNGFAGETEVEAELAGEFFGCEG